MVTAYGREEVLKQAEDSGFENVLIKPVTPSMLFDTAVVALGADGEQRRDRAGRPLLRHRHDARRAHLAGRGQRDQPGSRDGPARRREAFVDLAENGEVALRMIRDNDYDLVLMDMQMPVMDGVEATAHHRSKPRFETCRSLP